MPLPEAFSEWEHLQSTLMRTHNRLVIDEFRDIGDESWDPDITTPRGSLRTACTLKDSDSALQTFLRMYLFYTVVRGGRDNWPEIYGIPATSFQESFKFKPQIELYFLEDLNDVEAGYSPIAGEIKFRIMNEESESLTEAKLQSLARKISTSFASGNGFVWRKGKTMCTYTDKSRGYKLQLLCRDKAEGRRIVEQVLDIQGHSPDWAKMNVSENQEASQAYPTVPGTDRILGKNRRLPRRRAIADVRFQHAVAHVWGIPVPIPLVDRTHYYRNALVAS